VSGLESPSAPETIAALRRSHFPFEKLALHPVSAIEPLAVTAGAASKGVCAVKCLGCCAAAAPPNAKGMSRLSPRLFSGILDIAAELTKEDLHILSTVRLTLYNASNELDNPDCVRLRCLLSEYFDKTYGFPLGAISSDLAFHLSGTPRFDANLVRLLEMPKLWDNICFSIDEQIPIRDAGGYHRYLESLRRVWTTLRPALVGGIDHARPERRGAPRVILNMLVPEDGTGFRQTYRHLYPGGPGRALRFEELIGRYVEPFVGDVIEITPGLPAGHRFTSGIGRLSRLPGSLVYTAYNRYAPTGRGAALVRFPKAAQDSPRHINTKIYPVGAAGFRFRACFTTAPFADDEIRVHPGAEPDWFEKLDKQVITPTGAEC
jgi:hypothetical protein